jgi:hypothetical protein
MAVRPGAPRWGDVARWGPRIAGPGRGPLVVVQQPRHYAYGIIAAPKRMLRLRSLIFGILAQHDAVTHFTHLPEHVVAPEWRIVRQCDKEKT